MRDCDPYNCERCGEPVGEEAFRHDSAGPKFLCNECRENLCGPKVAPAVFLGIQESYGGNPPFCLFNLTADIAGNGYRFVSGSTVTQHSVELAGYVLPYLEDVKAQNAVLTTSPCTWSRSRSSTGAGRSGSKNFSRPRAKTGKDT